MTYRNSDSRAFVPGIVLTPILQKPQYLLVEIMIVNNENSKAEELFCFFK